MGEESLLVSVGATFVGLVHLIFCRTWSKWPLTIANKQGGRFRNVRAVRPGKLCKYPLASAVCRVLSADEKSVACANVIVSAGAAEPIAALVACVTV
jgi:hypothetical protein